MKKKITKMRVLLEFKTHHYWEEYEKTDYYCPNCGKRTVWENRDIGDYYEGSDLVCSECNFSFTMPSRGILNGKYGEIPKQIKSGIVNKPTTPLGN